VCRSALDEQADTIRQLEENVLAARQAALDAADTDSVITATSAATGDVESVVSAGQALPALPRSVPAPDSAGAEEEDFVDVVGDDEAAGATAPVDDSLEQDLQMSPENSPDHSGNNSSFRHRMEVSCLVLGKCMSSAHMTNSSQIHIK